MRSSTLAVVGLLALAAVAVLGVATAGSASALGCAPGHVDVVEHRAGEWYTYRGSSGCSVSLTRRDADWDEAESPTLRPHDGFDEYSDIEATEGGWRATTARGVAYAVSPDASNRTRLRRLPRSISWFVQGSAFDGSGHWWVGIPQEGVRVLDEANETTLRIPGSTNVDRIPGGIAILGKRDGRGVVRLYDVPDDWDGSRAALSVDVVFLDPVVDHPKAVEPRPGGGFVVVSKVGNAFVYDEDWRLVGIWHERRAVGGGLFWLSPAILVSVAGVAWSWRRGEESLRYPVGAFVAFVWLAVAVREGFVPFLFLYWFPDSLVVGSLLTTVTGVAVLVDGVEEPGLTPRLWVRYLVVATPVLVVATDYVPAIL